MTYLEISARCRQAAGIVGQGWCQDAMARTASGCQTLVLDQRATSFCFYGAISLANEWGHSRDFMAHPLMAFVRHVTGQVEDDLVDWNNAPERTQADVVAKLHAIADAAELKAIAVGEHELELQQAVMTIAV